MRAILLTLMVTAAGFSHASTNDAPNGPVSFGASIDNALTIPAPAKRPPAEETVTTVYPNKLERVKISVKDVNYLQCKNGVITDRTFSQEKPLVFKFGPNHTDAFLKLKARKEVQTHEVRYYTQDVDLYVVCDGEVYSMMLQPVMSAPRKIILDGGRAKEIASSVTGFSQKPWEETVIDLLDAVHNERGQLPGVYQVTKAALTEKWHKVTANTQARLYETVKLEGSGVSIHVYQMYSRLGDSLHEMDLVNAQLQDGVFAVRLYNHTPKSDQSFLGYLVTKEGM